MAYVNVVGDLTNANEAVARCEQGDFIIGHGAGFDGHFFALEAAI
jgi:hypothetical protein